MYVNGDNRSASYKAKYFDRFGVEHIPIEIKKFRGNKNTIASNYRIEAYGSIMCGYFCIGFTNFMLKVKSLLDYINLFSFNEYEKNDKIFSTTKKIKMKKIYCVIFGKYRKFKISKI